MLGARVISVAKDRLLPKYRECPVQGGICGIRRFSRRLLLLGTIKSIAPKINQASAELFLTQLAKEKGD